MDGRRKILPFALRVTTTGGAGSSRTRRTECRGTEELLGNLFGKKGAAGKKQRIPFAKGALTGLGETSSDRGGAVRLVSICLIFLRPLRDGEKGDPGGTQ